MQRRRFFQIIPLLLAAIGLKSAKVKIPVTKVHRNDIIGVCWQDSLGKEWMVKRICPSGYVFNGQTILNYWQNKYVIKSSDGKESLGCFYFIEDHVSGEQFGLKLYRYA